MTAIDDALAAPGPERRGELDAPPTKNLAVLTCMDARLDPLRDLGIDLGAAHVIRNAGGRATRDALRSLILSWHTLGTREVLVVHHTSCGVRTDDEAGLRAHIEDAAGVPLEELDLHTFDDDEQSVREDVATIAASPFGPPGLLVRGALHDLAAGEIREVEAHGTP